MGAAAAHHRRPHRNFSLQGLGGQFLAGEQPAHQALVKLAAQGEQLLANDVHADLFAVGLDHVVQFLDNIDLFHLFRERFDQLHRQRIHHAQLQVRGAAAHGLFGVLIRVAGGDDADGWVINLHAVDFRGLRPLGQPLGSFLHLYVLGPGERRQHDVFRRVLLIGLQISFVPVLQLHQASGMGDPGGQPQHHRGVKLLGKGIGQLGKVLAFLGIRRLQHGNLGANGMAAAVLLVLRGMHTRVVGHSKNHTAVDADITHGVKGVRGHVQAHVLHGAEGSGAGKARANGGLRRYLLVGRPFTGKLLIFGGVFRDFRTGGSRIAGNKTDACFIQASGNGLVAQH